LRLNKTDIDESLESLIDKTLIVATDDPYELAQLSNKKHIHDVASLVLNDFQFEFDSLTVANEITLGLVSMLIMCSANKFVGTPMSTYSNYIHRAINQKTMGSHTWLNIGKNVHKTGKKYSWNNYPDMSMNQKLWSREWPESLLMIGWNNDATRCK